MVDQDWIKREIERFPNRRWEVRYMSDFKDESDKKRLIEKYTEEVGSQLEDWSDTSWSRASEHVVVSFDEDFGHHILEIVSQKKLFEIPPENIFWCGIHAE